MVIHAIHRLSACLAFMGASSVAFAVPGGVAANLSKAVWFIHAAPSPQNAVMSHTHGAGLTLGVESIQDRQHKMELTLTDPRAFDLQPGEAVTLSLKGEPQGGHSASFDFTLVDTTHHVGGTFYLNKWYQHAGPGLPDDLRITLSSSDRGDWRAVRCLGENNAVFILLDHTGPDAERFGAPPAGAAAGEARAGQ